MIWAKVASFFLFLGVALGAFGAHALKEKLTPYSIDIFKTGVLYHMIHALGLFAVAWISTQTQDPRVFWAGLALTIGIILFSGSLYLLAVTGVKILGAITPLGGLSFLIGWLLLFLASK
jgi:uncharacterized membrane protein YgdD (TMEM256/DUF423 family)